MKFNLSKAGLFFAACVLVAACKHSGSGDYTTDQSTGVQYRFIKHDEKGNKPAIGDIANVEMIGKNDKDSILFNSITARRRPGDTARTFPVQLRKSFNGCLEQGITMMSVGDSAEFKINADSLYLKTFGQKQLPPFVKPGSFITFNIKLTSFQTKQQMQQEQQVQMQKMQAEMMKRKAEEPAAIAKYLADNHYTNVKPTKDSLFFLERKGGKGKAIKDGDSVAVNYEGSLLDGTVFDKSTNHGGPYKVLYNKDQMQVIAGWRLALGEMHEGESARILLPSAIAYGPQGMRPTIPPYSPLVFTMDVVKVWNGKK